MKKILIVILLFSGIAFSQTREEQIKIVLANFVLELDKTIKLNESLTGTINAIATDLQAIKEPSEELITLLKKYNIYKRDNGNIQSTD